MCLLGLLQEPAVPTLETVNALNELPEYPRRFVIRRLLVFVGIILG